MSRAGIRVEVTAKLARVRGWLDGSDTNTAGWPTVSGRPAILPV